MTPSTNMRLSAMAILVVSLVGALTVRLWFLTAVEGEAAEAEAAANRTRVIHIQAPRGRIFDRNYTILVDNEQVRQLQIDSEALNEAVGYEEDGRAEVFARVAEALTLYRVPHEDEVAPPGAPPIEPTPWTVEDIVDAYDNNAEGPFLPIPVADRVPEELQVLLSENQMEYPGMEVEPVAVRNYPHGTLAAHLLGYVKPISEEELETERVQDERDKPYAAGDDIGKSGVELSYERYLRGTPGTRVIEVDADNNVVRTVRYDPPVPGDDVMLAMDIRVQAVLETALREQAEAYQAPGAAGMVMDPSNGEVIAMASYPAFNPAEMSGRVSDARYAEIRDYLSNKAIAGEYLPGSTFKPVTALAALRAGLVDPAFTYVDQGVYQVTGCEGEGCEFQNPDQTPLGPVNLSSSLTVSSDTYYYRLGDLLWGSREEVGDDALQTVARDFGFGTATDIDLPAATDGSLWTPEILDEVVAENPERYVEGARWRTGDTVNLSIGQGYLGVTPVQLTNMYAAIGNGGVLYTPHVVREVLRPNPRTDEWDRVLGPDQVAPDPIGTVEIAPQWRASMMSGLLGVPTEGPLGRGTAATAFEGFDLASFPIAGKTGTAQKNQEEDYGLFVGMGPVRSEAPPDYVVSAVFEAAGGFGGEIAAPAARSVFDGLADPNNPMALPPVPNASLAEPFGTAPVADVDLSQVAVLEGEG